MTLEEIEAMWLEDVNIDSFKLGDESLKIPKLHAKYYQLYVREKLALSKMKEQQKSLELILEQFFAKTLTDQELDEYGLEYGDKKILKPDIPKYVDAHKDMVTMKLKIAMANEKVEFLKSIINMVQNRSFQIKDAIQWKIFEAGG